jgi:MFS family permease
MPPIMAYVAETAPTEYKGRLMAGMYYSLSLSGYLSGLIGSTLLKNYVSSNENLQFYSIGFSISIIILSVAAGTVLITRTICSAVYSTR